MTARELVSDVAARADIPESRARRAVKAVVAAIQAAVRAEDEPLTLSGVGTFQSVNVPARRASAFGAGFTRLVSPGRKVSFKPSRKLRALAHL